MLGGNESLGPHSQLWQLPYKGRSLLSVADDSPPRGLHSKRMDKLSRYSLRQHLVSGIESLGPRDG
jgi:hypothetical protein